MRDLFLDSDAVFSPCRHYRYRLSRIWDTSLQLCAFVMLNPSTADETANDPTSRRCMGFARAWNYGGVLQVNLFALRGSDPSVLLRHAAPVGPDNDAALTAATLDAALVVAAWGAHKAVGLREAHVLRLLAGIKPVHFLRMTSKGKPEHPLYLPGSLTPVPYEAGRAA